MKTAIQLVESGRESQKDGNLLATGTRGGLSSKGRRTRIWITFRTFHEARIDQRGHHGSISWWKQSEREKAHGANKSPEGGRERMRKTERKGQERRKEITFSGLIDFSLVNLVKLAQREKWGRMRAKNLSAAPSRSGEPEFMKQIVENLAQHPYQQGSQKDEK